MYKLFWSTLVKKKKKRLTIFLASSGALVGCVTRHASVIAAVCA